MNTTTKPSSRIDSIDLLRGIVLILMLLDHTRGFFSNIADPLSLVSSTPAVYFTRWITHLCAPVFIFLAGVSAYLYAHRANQGIAKTSYFLWTRGLWFVLMEWTVLFFAWTFWLTPYTLNFWIFAAIGFSMIYLALLIRLPHWLIGVISILLIVGHNLLDGIPSAAFANAAGLWMILHEQGTFNLGGIVNVSVYYCLLPWFGVIGLGYFMGVIFSFPEQRRRQYLLMLGVAFTVAFIVLRYINIYVDLHPWAAQETALLTLMAFLDTQKYPPSLAYILMTLGPGLILLSLISEKSCTTKINQMIITFGRVPFFFYLMHLFLLMALALSVAYFVHGFEIATQFFRENPHQYGYSIGIVYLVAGFLLFVLYFPCAWYGRIKAKYKKWYLSYL